jgi:CRP-like cAMP-binding protein
MKNLVNFLKQSDIFYQLTPTQLELIANLCEVVSYQSGDVIFRENSTSKELYIIVQGAVNILISTENSASGSPKNVAIIATLRRGQSFGEIALVDEGLRSASAQAAQKDTHLLVIQRDPLIMLCESYPPLG